jgi:hypothetical protein
MRKAKRSVQLILALSTLAVPATQEALAAPPPVCTNNPSVAQCRNTAFLNQCDNARVREVCGPILEADLKNGATDEAELYQPNRPKLKSYLVNGRVRPYEFVKPARTFAEQLAESLSPSWSKEERYAREKAWALPRTTAQNATTWRREPLWDGIFSPTASNTCEEYVYERFYTYQRFLDASYRCEQDSWCIANLVDERFLPDGVGANWPGGIRDIRSLWGTKVPAQVEQITTSVLPKNAFTTEAAVGFLPNAVIDAFPEYANQLRGKRDWMYQKRNHFGIGVTGSQFSEKFVNELDWHVTMKNRVKAANISEAERRQLMLRRDELSQSIKKFAQRWNATIVGGSQQSPPIPIYHSKEIPLDGVADRLLLNQLGSNFEDTLAATDEWGGNLFAIPRDKAQLLATAHPHLGTQTAAFPNAFQSENVAHPELSEADIGGAVAAAFAQYPPMRKAGSAVPQLRCASEAGTSFWVPANDTEALADQACKVSNLLLAEWARDVVQGDRGCLSSNFAGCDWTPEEFAERFAERQFLMPERQAELKRCEKYTLDFKTPDSFIPRDDTGMPVGNVTFGDARRDGAKMVTLLDNAEFAINSLLKRVPRRNALLPKFGESLSSTELIGDKKLFAAGYSAAMGWTADLVTNAAGGYCRMNAGVNGDVDVNVYVFNNNVSLLDAHALAAITNEPGQPSEGHAEAYVKVLGVHMFNEVNETINLNGVVNDFWDERETKKVPAFSMVFAAGPVPVVIEAGVGFFYGAKLSTRLNSPDNCVADQSNTSLAALLDTETVFTPYTGVDGYASLQAGIPAVLEVEISAHLNLIKVSLPVYGRVRTGIAANAGGYSNIAAVTFDAGADLELSTLSGYVDLTFTAFVVPVEMTMFEWDGLSTQVPLVKSPQVVIPVLMLE